MKQGTLVIASTLFQQCKRQLYTWTWTPPESDTEIRLIMLFAAKNGEVLYSQEKQGLEKKKAWS